MIGRCLLLVAAPLGTLPVLYVLRRLYMLDRSPPDSPSQLPRLLSYDDVAELLGVSTRTVYTRVAEGALVPTRIGGQVRFHPDDVERYIDRARGGVEL